jgi:hypothetical protein
LTPELTKTSNLLPFWCSIDGENPRNKYQALLSNDPPFAQALLRGFLRQISYECRELSRLAAN